jgi:spore maturation protein CgeB
MARVLISHFSPVHDGDRFTSVCFFDALAKGFTDSGHDVKQLISTRFLRTAWNGANTVHYKVARRQLAHDIRAFKPDLCIFANNSVPDVAYEVTDCPVVLLLSDTVNFFNDKDKIRNKSYGDRLFFYAPFARDLREIEQIFGKDSGKIIHLLPATEVQAEPLPVEHNISFIGSNFQNDKKLGELIRRFPDKKRLNEIMRTFRRDTSSLDILTEDEKTLIGSHFPLAQFPFIFSAKDRVMTLALLVDEGLGLFGSSSWHETAQYFPDLAAVHDPRKVYSLQHNQDIYNSSKVCLSVAHSQAEDGFPWRVMDIMASNGCLLSDRKSGLRAFTKGYVDLPMYDTPEEAKSLAQKLLRDEAWRRELVEGSQRCIADKGRWKHRFKDLQEQIGVQLIQASGSPGSLSFIQGEDYILPGALMRAHSRAPGLGSKQGLLSRLAFGLRR